MGTGAGMSNLITNFHDKRKLEWECFIDAAYYDMTCVRTVHDRDFNSPTSFHFNTSKQALEFVELIKESS